jgi:hypothetical protein
LKAWLGEIIIFDARPPWSGCQLGTAQTGTVAAASVSDLKSATLADLPRRRCGKIIEDGRVQRTNLVSLRRSPSMFPATVCRLDSVGGGGVGVARHRDVPLNGRYVAAGCSGSRRYVAAADVSLMSAAVVLIGAGRDVRLRAAKRVLLNSRNPLFMRVGATMFFTNFQAKLLKLRCRFESHPFRQYVVLPCSPLFGSLNKINVLSG